MFDIKSRFKNPTFYFMLITAIVMPVLTYFDLTFENFTTWDKVLEIALNAIKNPYVFFTILLSIIGVFINPVTKGIKD